MADANASAILDWQAGNPVTCTTKSWVYRLKDDKLCFYPNPRHHCREGLLPFWSEPACQTFLVRYVFTVQGSICWADQWGEWSSKLLGGKLVLPLLCFGYFVCYGIPREIGSDIAGCIGINDAIIKKSHPVAFPSPRASQSAWSNYLPFLSCAGTRTGSIVTPPHARLAT